MKPESTDSDFALAKDLLRFRRILLLGDMDTGKSTLAMRLLPLLTGLTGDCRLLELDPGTPPFGIPGTVCEARWRDDALQVRDVQALCTLDGVRFRLPLLLAARRLPALAAGSRRRPRPVLLDPPGAVRGVGGAELLQALTEALQVEAVVAVHRQNAPLPLAQELAALPVAVVPLPVSTAARTFTDHERLKHRTRLWNCFLTDAKEEWLSLDRLTVLGTPPPRDLPLSWEGRQAALLDANGTTVRLGETIRLEDHRLLVCMVPCKTSRPAALLLRDAGRNPAGYLATIKRHNIKPAERKPPTEMVPSPLRSACGEYPVSSDLGHAWATLVGGVLGDPLVHVRLRRRKESLLFDLGDSVRLMARHAHQVSAVFLSHAHIDHVSGFNWFLRSRIGPFGPCRIYGPQNTIQRIESFIAAVTWDRIDDTGPVFEVLEIVEDMLHRARLQPGKERVDLPDLPIRNGAVLSADDFTVRAAVCDHHIPSVAYALNFTREIKVRKDRLAAAGLAPGPWLGELKQRIAAGTLGVNIELPNGTAARAEHLAKELTIVLPGKTMVYAADMADIPENQAKVIKLARAAHTLFCEAAFIEADRDKALATQHLTTLAAARIARQAGVERLIPFHFSKRYEKAVHKVYDEILAAAGPVRVFGCSR